MIDRPNTRTEFTGKSRGDLWAFLKRGGISRHMFQKYSFKSFENLYLELAHDGVKLFLTSHGTIERFANSVRLLLMSPSWVLLETHRTSQKVNPNKPDEVWTIYPKWIGNKKTPLIWSLSETRPVDENQYDAVMRCTLEEAQIVLDRKNILDITKNITGVPSDRIEDPRPSRVYYGIKSYGSSRYYMTVLPDEELVRFVDQELLRDDHGCNIHLRAFPIRDYPTVQDVFSPSALLG